MHDSEPDVEAIVREMHAEQQWLGLTRDQRAAWLSYVDSEGEQWRRGRAMEACNRLLDGQTAPPSPTLPLLGKVRVLVEALALGLIG